ncbi:MAG: AAA family ATPase [Armatimonadetes bacterium]|nr:AAA family ATPase [Armatimonadota bacterium]
MPSKVDQELETLIRARYPLIYIVSWEEKRVEDALRQISANRGKRMYVWTITQGMVLSPTASDDRTRSPLSALDFVLQCQDPALFVLKDFHPFLKDTETTRRLRDLTYNLKTSFKTLIVLSPMLQLPPELEKEVTVIDYSLPVLEDLDRLLENIIQSVRHNPQIDTRLTPDQREHLLEAALGLTANEAENVFARSLVEKRRFDVDVILTEKEQIIRKSGTLEYFRHQEGFGDVGGLDMLKNWMRKRAHAFSQRAREFGLPAPRGVLILGVQGCGKSLCCKAVANQWRLPLLRMDVGKIFSGIVGSSEENIRRAIRTAESLAPTVLWLDELEKGLSGTQSSAFSDGGTTARVFATFVTWLQEKTAPVFVVATANNIEHLPPELMRKGRFDEIFFVDLPSVSERREIFEIHIKKRKRDPARFDLDLLAELSEGFSGAEIEQVVVSALYDAFDAGRDITTEDLRRNVRESVPLSRTMRERIEELREWAETRARAASSPNGAAAGVVPVRAATEALSTPEPAANG